MSDRTLPATGGAVATGGREWAAVPATTANERPVTNGEFNAAMRDVAELGRAVERLQTVLGILADALEVKAPPSPALALPFTRDRVAAVATGKFGQSRYDAWWERIQVVNKQRADAYVDPEAALRTEYAAEAKRMGARVERGYVRWPHNESSPEWLRAHETCKRRALAAIEAKAKEGKR